MPPFFAFLQCDSAVLCLYPPFFASSSPFKLATSDDVFFLAKCLFNFSIGQFSAAGNVESNVIVNINNENARGVNMETRGGENEGGQTSSFGSESEDDEMDEDLVDVTNAEDHGIPLNKPGSISKELATSLMQSDEALEDFLFSQTNDPQEVVIKTEMYAITLVEMLFLMSDKEIPGCVDRMHKILKVVDGNTYKWMTSFKEFQTQYPK